MYRTFGVIFLVLAVAIAVVPMFSDCQSQGRAIALANGATVPMKCHWTGVAALASAVPLFFVGGMFVAGRRQESLGYLSLLGVVLGGVIVALPTKLIGVCATPTMICVTVERPALVGMGAVVIAMGLVGLVRSMRRQGTQ
jgi:hypothetical protein